MESKKFILAIRYSFWTFKFTHVYVKFVVVVSPLNVVVLWQEYMIHRLEYDFWVLWSSTGFCSETLKENILERTVLIITELTLSFPLSQLWGNLEVSSWLPFLFLVFLLSSLEEPLKRKEGSYFSALNYHAHLSRPVWFNLTVPQPC